jgi:hypothetical protein
MSARLQGQMTLKGCIIKILDKNLSEGLSKIGNNSKQHALGHSRKDPYPPTEEIENNPLPPFGHP